MFDFVLENLRKATDAGLQLQQNMMKEWMGQWPTMTPTTPVSAWSEKVQKFQKQWTEMVHEMIEQQRKALEEPYLAGMKHLEETFKVSEAKDLDELRAKSIELWKKSFECLRQGFESQLQVMQKSLTQWTELMTKGAA
jgi:polyhydroxyalkanoate synthesis regulator protein